MRSAQRRKMHWNESYERSTCVYVGRTIDWPKVTSSAPDPSRLAPNSENATALWRPLAIRDPVDMTSPEARRTTGLPHLRARARDRACVCLCSRQPRPARLLKPQPRRRAYSAGRLDSLFSAPTGMESSWTPGRHGTPPKAVRACRCRVRRAAGQVSPRARCHRRAAQRKNPSIRLSADPQVS